MIWAKVWGVLTGLEFWGFVTGAACVWLAVKEHVWNWPIGIVNNVLYLLVFFHSKLYADSLLQIFFIAVGIYGWWAWLYGGTRHTELQAGRTTKQQAAIYLVALIASTAGIYFLLSRYTDSNVPFWDGITTALSLVAQYMLGRKLLENWLVWILADIIYIAVYSYKHLYLTSVLYLVFMIMCVAGWKRWKQTLAPGELSMEAAG
jgi:nicotinamide mononucleotide transporter